jgi:ribosomal protein L11 methyltransferase
VRLTVRTRATAGPVVLAEACALLGGGCRERALGEGEVAFDFWLPAAGAPDPERVRARLAESGLHVAVTDAPEPDGWRRALRAYHRPVEIRGRLRVRPPWSLASGDAADVVIDPGMAFGTGQHATTRGCLELLVECRPGSLLDVGCGSGILAIAARRLGHDPVWAVDLDPLAVEATIANARANGVALRVGLREIGCHRLPQAETVVANLTGGLVAALAREVASAPPRLAILSGLRHDEARAVAEAWSAIGFQQAARVDDEGWTSLLVARDPAGIGGGA